MRALFLAVAALLAPAAAAQIDQWDWDKFGAVAIGPASITFGDYLYASSTSVHVPQQGTLHFTVRASFQKTPNISHLYVYAAGTPVMTAGGATLPFCSPAPCSSTLGSFTVHVNEGDVFMAGFDDSDEFEPLGAHVVLSQISFTPDLGIVDLGGGLGGGELHTWTGLPSSFTDFGENVVALEDVDGDGLGDVLVGSPSFDDSGAPNPEGRIDVYSGASGAPLWSLEGTPDAPYLGTHIDRAGDIDGDGLGDVLVGQPYVPVAGQQTGAVELRRGFDGALIHQYLGTQPLKGFGYGVGGLQDLDLDGTPDLAVDQFWATPGSIVCLSGASGATLFTIVPGVGAIADAGDVNGDGLGDVLVGMNSMASVYSGAGGALLHTWTGAPGDFFGVAVDGAGDVNADGLPDVLVGAPQFDLDNEGYARVFAGATDQLLFEVTGDGVADGDEFGVSVAGVGDGNGDGFADVLVGALGDDFKGSARLFAGPGGAQILKLAVPGANGGNFGTTVSGGFDTDGDGRPDLLVGAPTLGPSGYGPGAVFLYSGNPADHVPPLLAGTGTLHANSPLAIALSGGPSSGLCALVVGVSAMNLPFKGGVLVPAANLVLGLVLDPTGALQLAGTWPAGVPSGSSTWLQAWMPSPSGPKGWEASNAVQLIAP